MKSTTIQNYSNAVCNLYEAETPENIDRYKESVMKILFPN